MNTKIVSSFLLMFVIGLTSANFDPDFVDQTYNEDNPMQMEEVEATRQRRMDLAALASSPMAKMALQKGMEMLKNPSIQALMKSDKIKELMKPETIKKMLNSEMAKNIMKPETLKAAMDSPMAKNVLENKMVKQMMESDALKGYMSKAKEMMPQMMELAQAQLKKYSK